MNEADKFFENLPSDDKPVADIFAPEDKTETKEPLEKEEVVDESVKNRRHKRLERQLREAQDMTTALNERIKTLSEVEKFSKEQGVNPDVAKMFDSSDLGKENAMRLSALLAETAEKAQQKAIDKIREENKIVAQEQKNLESFIDSKFESLEDEFGVDLTSDAPAARKARREFGELLEKVSPKDENGEIKEYADFHSTFELYKSSKTEDKPSRNKELASRSMQKSGAVDSTKQNYDANLAYLRSIGVNV